MRLRCGGTFCRDSFPAAAFPSSIRRRRTRPGTPWRPKGRPTRACPWSSGPRSSGRRRTCTRSPTAPATSPSCRGHFIERLTRPGERVYDPFSGRGTTAMEAALLGRRVAANDVNPLSRMLAEPRLTPPEPVAVAQRLKAIPGRAPPMPWTWECSSIRLRKPRSADSGTGSWTDKPPANWMRSTPGSAWWPPTGSRATAPGSSPSTPCRRTRRLPPRSSGRSTSSGSRFPPIAIPIC